LLTTIVRILCALVDVGALALLAVAAVRFHRRGMDRIRTAYGRPVAEPRSNVVPLQRGRA
jgi:hypothetical protein